MRHFESEQVDRLFQAILLLKSKEECYRFFDDLCTIKEIQDMAQRLSTAEQIERGISYQKISDQIGVSTATISRVSRCLNYGAGGYREILSKLREDDHGKK